VTSGSSSSPTAFTVTNTGSVPSGVLTPSLGASVDFVFGSTNTCTGTLAPGAHCEVDVSFAPSGGGAKTASLQVSATPGGQAVARLSGSGG
jgi:hypothetical protein